jgi:probable DNA repair protein
MIERLLPEIENGAIVLTANRRLARSLRDSFHAVRLQSGLRCWSAPRILPFSTWLHSIWSDAVLSGDVRACLLNEVQELSLWEQIIRADSDLLQPREAARVAAQAWQLSKQYLRPHPNPQSLTNPQSRTNPQSLTNPQFPTSRSEGAFAPDTDTEAYSRWATEFATICRDRQWLTAAELPDALVLCDVPRRAILCGFDEFTPQQQEFLDKLAAAGCDWLRLNPLPRPSIDARRASSPDATAEFRAAANWCRNLVETGQARRIGVIVRNLSAVRDQVERIFTQELDPGAVVPSPAFHISAGKPLSKYPLVRAALLFLKLGRNRLSLSDAGAILRSPYLPGSDRDFAPRAMLDVRLRKYRQRRISPSELRGAISLDALEALWKALARTQSPGGWAASFARMLEAVGWPGDTALSSAEYQSRDAFQELLDDLASHDLTTPAWGFSEAYDRLDELAACTEFGPEDQGAPVQIMGVLESSGSQFDALWVTGLHDGAWPQPAHPNPFLPLAAQREHNVPHSSNAREYEFSRIVTARLLASAPVVVLSYPRLDKDAELRPSPFLSGLPEGTSTVQSEWLDFLHGRAAVESVIDTTGPPVNESQSRGGTAILKNQAACPFRAFAEHRLGAKPLDEPEPGIGRMDCGRVLHGALEQFWREIGSHQQLMATPPETLASLAGRSVDQAFGSILKGTRLREIERDRLAGLILEWLDVERQRAPFQVSALEDRREVELGGLKIKTRMDRVDQLPGGGQIIIDYKANAPSLNRWEGDRPAEPQLPLYASRCATNVTAALFANLRPGDLKFTGIAGQKGVAPGARTEALGERIAEWGVTLENIAREFAGGRADVDPRKSACDNCGLTPLCRIAEIRD